MVKNAKPQDSEIHNNHTLQTIQTQALSSFKPAKLFTEHFLLRSQKEAAAGVALVQQTALGNDS